LSGKEPGIFLGASGAATTMRYNQFCRNINENKKLNKRVQKNKKQLLNP
jgi:hypothetical protein